MSQTVEIHSSDGESAGDILKLAVGWIISIDADFLAADCVCEMLELVKQTHLLHSFALLGMLFVVEDS